MQSSSPTGRLISRRTLFGGMAAGAVTLLVGCSFGGGGKPAAAGGKVRLAITTPIDSLDPHYVNNGSYITPCGLLEGLVLQDKTGKGVVPAIAEKWDVSADGLTYTFHLRADAKFSNGDPIAAKDFEWTYKRLFTPSAAGGGGAMGANAYKPSLGIAGATDYIVGSLTDWSKVGVKAKDDKTLVLTLDTPNSAFLIGLTTVSMLLLHQASVEKDATGWMKPENWVSSGPYVLTEWTPNASASMKKHDNYWDKGNIHVEQMDVRVITATPALLLAYRNNEIDIIHTPTAEIAGDATLTGQTKAAKGYSVYYLQAMYSQHPAAQDARVRQAISMVIDRTTVAKVEAGSSPGPALVPDSVPGWDKSLAVQYDVAKAKSLLSDAGYPGGKGMPTIQFLESKAPAWTDAVSDMVGSALGVTVKTKIVESGQFGIERIAPIDDPGTMGFYTGTFGGLPNLNNWVFDLWGPDTLPSWSLPVDQAKAYQAVQADKKLSAADKVKQLAAIIEEHASPEAKKFAETARAAKAIVDPDKQTAAYLDAARQRAAMSYQIPIVWGVSSLTVKPAVSGVHLLYTPNSFYLKGLTLSA